MRSVSVSILKIISPPPARFSAPGESRITLESVLVMVLTAILVGKVALIESVMTFLDGRWVARMMWMPTALPFCAKRMMDSVISREIYLDSSSRPAGMVRSAYSSMMVTM